METIKNTDKIDEQINKASYAEKYEIDKNQIEYRIFDENDELIAFYKKSSLNNEQINSLEKILIPNEETETNDTNWHKKRTIYLDKMDTRLPQFCYDFNDGILNLNPEWQREFVWDSRKKSALIESFLLNIPIPPIFLSENEDSSFEVIDGQQRLRTIINFFNNKFKLVKLSVCSKLNNKKFQDLDQESKNILKRTTIRTIIVLKNNMPTSKFDIYNRINTGACLLRKQEIRDAIHFHEQLQQELLQINKYLDINEGNSFIKKTGRGKTREWILRFLSMFLIKDKKINFYSRRDILIENTYNYFQQHNDEISTYLSLLKKWDDKINEKKPIQNFKVLFYESLFKTINISNYNNNVDFKQWLQEDENAEYYINRSIITQEAIDYISNGIKKILLDEK